MAWIDKLANETAAQLKTRLDTLGAKVYLSEESTSTIASASANNVLKSVQTVKTWEYRGLAKDAATLLRGCAYDNATSVTLYATASASAKSKSSYVSASVTSGTVLHVAASRADESDKWVARFTETTHSYSGNGWSTSEPAVSSTGHVVSVSKKKLVNRFSVNGTVLQTILQTVTTTVTEYCYLTQSAANSLCANPTDNMNLVTVTATDSGGTVHSFQYSAGSTVSFDMRFVSASEGWTVTKTEETRGAPPEPQNA